jgi:hypothetical protein
MVRGFKKCWMSDEMDGMEVKGKSGMLAVSTRQDGNCEDVKQREGIRMVSRNW